MDMREWIPTDMDGRLSLRRFQRDSGAAHPGSNGVGAVRWSAAEAEAQIEAVVDAHRRRGLGFTWYVGPLDTPADLRARLEQHGLVLAGEAAMMARLGLDDLEAVPVNPDLTIEAVDGTAAEPLEAALRVAAVAFHLTEEQVAEWRATLVERANDPRVRDAEMNYLARLAGQPAGLARLTLRAGLAYLGGAGTLPEYRGQKVYSTLLRRRLETARERGYHLAAIHAEPMSRRVVARYGFKEYARTYVYAWMPVIDLDVIRSLVPDE